MANVDERAAAVDAERLHLKSPQIEPTFIGVSNQRHRAIDATTRVPAVAFLLVFKHHFYQVVACVNVGGDVHTEGVVAVCPMSGFLAVHAHFGIRHCTVELQFGVGGALGYVDGGFVESFSNPWERSGAARVLGGFVFAIFLDGNHL